MQLLTPPSLPSPPGRIPDLFSFGMELKSSLRAQGHLRGRSSKPILSGRGVGQKQHVSLGTHRSSQLIYWHPLPRRHIGYLLTGLLDNRDGMITHLEPDILECKVKWALENITMNKASGGDGIPVELFQIPKDDAAFDMPANLENSTVATGLEKVSFHSNP